MTEAEWLACSDPAEMLDAVGRRASQRKLRLFACACARRAESPLVLEARDAVETAEQFADGLVAADELDRVRRALPVWATPRMPALRPALSAAKRTARSAAELIGWKTPSDLPPWTPAHRAARAAEERAQCALLRDLFGNLFRAVSLHSVRLALAAEPLARAAYDERIPASGELEQARFVLLADALEEAGCTEAAILSHLRGPGPHVRGCWALDLILGRE